jgi:hypothetical protein
MNSSLRVWMASILGAVNKKWVVAPKRRAVGMWLKESPS